LRCWAMLLCFLFSTSAVYRVVPPPVACISAGICFRAGEPRDSIPIALTLLAMKMNPLSIDYSRFIVCETDAGLRVGFGQIRKLGTSRAVDASQYNAQAGSFDADADADDAAWDDLAEEDIASGLDSLPWSAGYRKMAQRAQLQRSRRGARLAQSAAEAAPLWELASIFVEAAWRRRGIGEELVRRLLEAHETRGGYLDDVYLLTLEPTCGWYERLGFKQLASDDQIPAPMAFEVAAGKALSTVLGNKLVCMRGARVRGATLNGGQMSKMARSK